MTITHYDLFAGIGGFSLALEEIFDDATIRHIFCEWESFPTSVLRQHWPDGEFYGDIADLVTDTPRPADKGWSIVTGGFPCQPFSQAGLQKGTADDRYQWPNMYQVIRNVRPEWVIAENVRGLTTWNDGVVLETVCTDLEAEGYETRAFIIPAVAVGAPHRRDRVWIIAKRLTADPQHTGLERHSQTTRQDTQGRQRQDRHIWPSYSRDDWPEVAARYCGVGDGLSRIVDGVSYSHGKWRKESLKAYGNGIVPEVAMNIMQAIKESI